MTERWLPIPGYEGRYDVSDLGRVRSWLQCRGTPVPRILKARPGSNGYLSFCLSKFGRQVDERLHALVLLAFVGPRPEGKQRRHRDGDQLNNTLANLTYGTKSENELDRVRHGTHNNSSKTECKHGHPFDEMNTRFDTIGRRICRACVRERRRAALRLGLRTGDSL